MPGDFFPEDLANRITGFAGRQWIRDKVAEWSLSGTQLYMAPELFWGKPASIRSDIYALGVVLYQLLAGDSAVR